MSEVAEKLKSETALVNLDGFDGYTDESEAQDQEDFAPSARVIQGDRISFSKQGIWVDRAKQPLPGNLLLLVHDVICVVQKWGTDGMPRVSVGPDDHHEQIHMGDQLQLGDGVRLGPGREDPDDAPVQEGESVSYCHVRQLALVQAVQHPGPEPYRSELDQEG